MVVTRPAAWTSSTTSTGTVLGAKWSGTTGNPVMNLSFVTTLGIGRMPFLNERASFQR